MLRTSHLLQSIDPPLPLDATNVQNGCPIAKQSVPNWAKTDAVTSDQRGFRIQFRTKSLRCFAFFVGCSGSNPEQEPQLHQTEERQSHLASLVQPFCSLLVSGQLAGPLRVRLWAECTLHSCCLRLHQTQNKLTLFFFCFLYRAFSIMKTKNKPKNAPINSGLIYYWSITPTCFGPSVEAIIGEFEILESYKAIVMIC